MANKDTAQSKYAPPSDSKALVEWLEKKRTAGESRLPEVMMRMHMAFVLGHQWVVWDASRGMFRRPANRVNDPNPPVRITANKIGGIVERTIAKLTKEAPTPEARPASNSESDVDGARVATRILTHEMDRLHWADLLVDFYFWPITLGWSFIHPHWNPENGPNVGNLEGQELFQGEIEIDIVPAFELAVDPNARTMDDAEWCIRTTSWTKEAVWIRWGKDPEGAESGRSLADEVYSLSTSSAASTPALRENKSMVDFIKVHQFWLKPGKLAPAGLVITWSGNTILEGPMPFPYTHGQLPFVQFDLLPGMGTREGRTWVTDLIPLQIDYNDARSREATVRRLLTPKVLAPVGSIDPQRVTSRVEVITYMPTGAAPTMFVPDSGWMAQYEEGMKRADFEMGERAGQADVSSGRAPSASMPAAAILALQEADATKLAISAKLLAAGIERVGYQILQLAKQFWTEQRIVRTWSDDGELEVVRFSGSDISDGFDVHVKSESGVAQSKSARAQLALDLNARGVPPFNDPRTLLRFLDLPGTDLLMDTFTVDVKQAHRENGLLIQGQTVEINDFDNHLIHIEEHDRLRKSEDYEKIKMAGQQGDQQALAKQAAMDAHVAAHKEVVASLMAAQQDGQPGVPNNPDGTPGTPQPGSGPKGPGQYIDPVTGKPANPTAVAAGQAPSALTNSTVGRRAGIGGPAQPGHVQGASSDQQAKSMGR